MKLRYWLAVLAALPLGGLPLAAAPAPVYENRGDVSMPVVDATVFLNRGTFSVASGSAPYDTQNTKFYTNFAGATISGSGGFQFDLVGDDGLRKRATSFVNQGIVNFGGDLFSDFVLADGDIGSGFGFFPAAFNSSWILVNASNVVNRGGLTVGSSGLIRLEGNNVNVSRSGLRAGEDPFQPIRQGTARGLTYRNDAGVTDLYWGAGMNNVLDPAGPGPFDLAVLTGSRPSSGEHEVLDRTTLTNLITLSATNVFAITNKVNSSNWVVQAVFVNTNTPDPDFKVAVKWSGSPRISNVPGTRMPIVQFTLKDIDTITTEPYTNFVYILDSLGAMTNAVLATNLATRADQRPTSLVVTRVTPPEWAAARTNTVPWSPDLLYNANYASQTVTNVYAAYSAMIGEVNSGTSSSGGGGFASLFAPIPELTHPTNLPGRIEIKADKLDLSLSRFRSDGLLSLTAKELVGQAPYKLDSAAVSADVSLSSGTLQVKDLIQPVVRRFNGIVSAWSAAWTNQTFAVGPDPADPTLQATNVIDVRFHALIVNYQFITRQTVQTYQFAAHTKHLILNDDLTIQESFVADAPDVDLQSQVNLQSIPISEATFPTVNNLTNGVSLSTFVGATFGSTNRPIPNLVNQGFISASSINVYAADLSNSGSISSFVGDVDVRTRNVKMDGGAIASAGNLRILADKLTATGSLLSAGYEARNQNTGNTNYFLGSLSLDVTSQLTDGGVTASNVWTVYDGVQLLRKPAQGDLLGTKIISKASRFAEVINVWAGADRGATAAGFENNAALGQLVLDGRSFSLYTFRAPSATPAALYVDHLELAGSTATDPEGSLNIEPGFTLYFAGSNLDPSKLDGLFEGRLRWVKTVAGANSGVNVTLASGQTLRVNRGLLTASDVDSDLDGIPNASDSAPFESSALKLRVGVVAGAPNQVELSWGANPGARYRVEYSTRLHGGDWQPLATCEHKDSAPGVAKLCDTLSTTGEQRYYRVIEVR